MTHETHPERLLKLSETALTMANPDEDVRGRQVLDIEVEEIGVIDEVLIDNREAKMRFIEVASGGLFGGGRQKFLIPIDAIIRITDKVILLNQTRQRVVDAPPYDPEIVCEDMVDQPYFGDVYDHYGQKPYWHPGYAYPASLDYNSLLSRSLAEAVSS
jgi:sporulation protein YlmC with PRC-barrel domain